MWHQRRRALAAGEGSSPRLRRAHLARGRTRTRAGGRDVGEGEAKGQSDQGQRDPLALLLFRGGELVRLLGLMQILRAAPERIRVLDGAGVHAAALNARPSPPPAPSPRFLRSSPECACECLPAGGDYHWWCRCWVACREEIPVWVSVGLVPGPPVQPVCTASVAHRGHDADIPGFLFSVSKYVSRTLWAFGKNANAHSHAQNVWGQWMFIKL